MIQTITASGYIRIPFGTDGGFDAVPLTVLDMTPTLDETWSPYFQADVVCVMTDVAEALSIDPTEREMFVFIDVIQSGDSGEDYARTYQGLLRERNINYANDTFTLTVSSREALLQDDAHVQRFIHNPGTYTYLWQLVNNVLARTGQVLTNVSGPAQQVLTNSSMLEWQPGVTAWDYIIAQVREKDLHLWCDEKGMWSLRDVRTPIASELVIGAGLNLLTADDNASRENDYYNAVVVQYNWADADKVQHVDYAFARDDTLPGRDRVYNKSVNAQYPGNGQAQAILNRLVKDQYSQTLSAIADHRFTPSQNIIVQTPAGSQAVAVAAVTFSTSTDVMTVRTRAR